MTFAPDHSSDHYSDGIRIELFGQVMHSANPSFLVTICKLSSLGMNITTLTCIFLYQPVFHQSFRYSDYKNSGTVCNVKKCCGVCMMLEQLCDNKP